MPWRCQHCENEVELDEGVLVHSHYQQVDRVYATFNVKFDEDGDPDDWDEVEENDREGWETGDPEFNLIECPHCGVEREAFHDLFEQFEEEDEDEESGVGAQLALTRGSEERVGYAEARRRGRFVAVGAGYATLDEGLPVYGWSNDGAELVEAVREENRRTQRVFIVIDLDEAACLHWPEEYLDNAITLENVVADLQSQATMVTASSPEVGLADEESIADIEAMLNEAAR